MEICILQENTCVVSQLQYVSQEPTQKYVNFRQAKVVKQKALWDTYTIFFFFLNNDWFY